MTSEIYLVEIAVGMCLRSAVRIMDENREDNSLFTIDD